MAAVPMSSDDPDADEDSICRFRSTPPRHFDYPAILLLLAEEPCHGYGLVEQLQDLGLVTANRPAVYRALAGLEQDGLLDSWNAEPLAGSQRRVYGVTHAGHAQLAVWMEIVVSERETLDAALCRYRNITAQDLPEMSTTND